MRIFADQGQVHFYAFAHYGIDCRFVNKNYSEKRTGRSRSNLVELKSRISMISTRVRNR